MAGASNAVEVVLRARNEAKGTFDDFGKDLRTVTGSMRLFAGAIATEINPGLGQMLFAMAAAGREVKNFGVGMATIGVSTAAAAIGIAQLISNFNDATRRTVEFQTAVASLNFGAVKGQIDAAAKSLEIFDKSLFGIILNATRTQGSFNLLDKIFGRESLETFLKDAREGFVRVLPIERLRIVNEEYAKQIESLRAIQQIESERFATQNRLGDFLTTQRTIEQSLNLQADAQERLLKIEKDRRDAEARARPGGALPGELGLSQQEFDERRLTLRQQVITQLQAVRERTRIQQQQIIERQFNFTEQQGIPAPLTEGATGEISFTSEEQLFNLRHDRLTEELGIQRQRVSILQEIQGLTRSEAAAIELRAVAADRALKIEDARGNIVKIELADLEAQARAANIILAELERTNPLAGLAKGFKDVAEAAESSGQAMQDFARSTASSMQRSFSDLFFNVVTGNFKNFADVGKQLGLNLARNFTDALAQSATAPILRGLAGLTGGFFPDSGVSLLNIAPEGSALVNSLQRAGFNVGGGTGRGGGGGGGGGGLYGDIYNGQTAQAFVESSPIGGGGPTGAPVGAGFNVGDYAGLGIGLTGLGLGILAANSSGTQAGAFGAAATGLTAGAGIATLLGASAGAAYGIGSLAAVVAIVGYIAIADATRAQNDRPNTGWRAIELAHVLDADIVRIRGTRSFLELAEAIRGAMHQAYGGPRTGYSARQTAGQPTPQGRGGSMATAGFAVSIAGQSVVLDGGSYTPTMTLADFAVLLQTQSDSLQVRLQLGAPEQYLQQIDNAFEQAVKDQANALRAFGTIPVSFDEFGPGLRRTTLVAAGALETFPGAAGQALSIDRQAGRQLGLTDDQIDAFLRRLSDRNTQTDRFPDLPRDVRLIL